MRQKLNLTLPEETIAKMKIQAIPEKGAISEIVEELCRQDLDRQKRAQGKAISKSNGPDGCGDSYQALTTITRWRQAKMAKRSLSQSKKFSQSEVKKHPLTLGQHIEAVLNHPDTSKNVYNALAETVTDLCHNPVATDSAEIIQALIYKNRELPPEVQEG